MVTSFSDSLSKMAVALTPLTVAAGDCKGIRYIDAARRISKDWGGIRNPD